MSARAEVKVSVDGVWKVFGPNPDDALQLTREGHARSAVLEQTGSTVAVADVSLEVRAGETFVVMGLSGSGKSTLLRCINRLVEPNRGTVRVDGEDVTAMDDQQLRQLRRRKLGMVFQRFALFPHRTVLDNVAYGLEIQKVDHATRATRARETLELVGLQGWESSRTDALSGGMQQRVGLARALATDPDVLLMDEPFSALDPLIRREMQDELLELEGQLAKTIVFITHDLDEALKLADRMAIMKDGAIVQIGTPEEILRRPADDYVRSFVEDVDRSRMLQARDVMFRPRDLVRRGHSPRVALRMMEQKGLSSAFVVGADNRLVGLVTAEGAADAARRGDEDLEGVLIRDIATTEPNTTLRELINQAADEPYPIAVVDNTRQLLGLVAWVSIIRGLAERDSVDDVGAEWIQVDQPGLFR